MYTSYTEPQNFTYPPPPPHTHTHIHAHTRTHIHWFVGCSLVFSFCSVCPTRAILYPTIVLISKSVLEHTNARTHTHTHTHDSSVRFVIVVYYYGRWFPEIHGENNLQRIAPHYTEDVLSLLLVTSDNPFILPTLLASPRSGTGYENIRYGNHIIGFNPLTYNFRITLHNIIALITKWYNEEKNHMTIAWGPKCFLYEWTHIRIVIRNKFTISTLIEWDRSLNLLNAKLSTLIWIYHSNFVTQYVSDTQINITTFLFI